MNEDTLPYSDLKQVQELLYEKCDFELSRLTQHRESKEYGACTFELNGHQIEHRISKITPTKTGQFVTIWKRNKNGQTEPFDSSDSIDFIVITSKMNEQLGQFIFPKSVLAEKGIITHQGKVGKRGIRVYPSWDVTTNKQAEKTQRWQTNYFVLIEQNKATDLHLTKKLLSKTI